MNNEFLQQVAFCTAIVIGFAFMIGAHPFRSRKRLVVPVKEEPMVKWTISDYYRFVNANVLASNTMEQLEETMAWIDAIYDKEFRVSPSRSELKDYYERLLRSYCQRENELCSIPISLCKN